jgi:predicted ATP-dependent endonuclease of OLD family
MKIKNIKIKNFRSIKNALDWNINEDKVEILVGKNSIGKSAILDALLYFNKERKTIGREDKPNNSIDKESELSINLELSKQELINLDINLDNYYSNKQKKQKDLKLKETTLVKISKIFSGLNNVFYKINNIDISEYIFEDIQEIKHLLAPHGNTFNYTQYSIFSSKKPIQDLKTLQHDLLAIRNFYTEIRKKIEPNSPILKDFVYILDIIEKIKSYDQRISQIIPKFIKFEFEIYGQLDNQVKYNNATFEREIIKHLFNVMHLHFKEFTSNAGQYHIIEELSKNREKKFEEFLSKNFIENISKIEMKFHPSYMVCSINDGHISTTISQRSSGEKWMLSFLLFIYYHRRLNENIIILIDEPNVNLHPNAQKSIMKVLEKIPMKFKKIYIFYSTHSPYLIPKNKINRISRVFRSRQRGTEIIKFDYTELLRLLKSRLTKSTPTIETIKARHSQMFTVSLKEIFFGTGVLLCEGHTERLSIPIWAELMKYGLYDNGLVLIQASKFNMINYAEFLSMYNIPFFLIFDNDHDNKDTDNRKKHIEHNRWLIEIAGGTVEDFPEGYSDTYYIFSPNYESCLRNADSKYIGLEEFVSKTYGTSEKKGIRARYTTLRYKELGYDPPEPIRALINSIISFRSGINSKELN